MSVNKVAYDVGCIVSQVIQWWQDKYPTIHEVRIGYSYWGNPSISIHYQGADGESCAEYVDCVVIGTQNALNGGVITMFEKALERKPLKKVKP